MAATELSQAGQGHTESKKLLVDFSCQEPKFEFLGSWTGKDVRIVLTHARRAYYLHNKDIRQMQSWALQREQNNATPRVVDEVVTLQDDSTTRNDSLVVKRKRAKRRSK